MKKIKKFFIWLWDHIYGIFHETLLAVYFIGLILIVPFVKIYEKITGKKIT